MLALCLPTDLYNVVYHGSYFGEHEGEPVSALRRRQLGAVVGAGAVPGGQV